MTRLLTGFVFALAVLLVASAARADVIFEIRTRTADSGWDMILADGIHNGAAVDGITSTSAVIEIAKEFYLPDGSGPNRITFRQRLDDAHTLTSLIIADEFISNYTGKDWHDYHWQLLSADNSAAFDAAATDASGFSIAPFTFAQWGPSPANWDADHSLTLSVSGGTLTAGAMYRPGVPDGSLFIDVDLGGDDPVEFVLQQTPTPEPATLALLAGGAALATARRRRLCSA